MNSRYSFEFESIEDPDTIGDIFKELLTGLDDGVISVKSQGDLLELVVSNDLQLSVKALKRMQEGELILKIKWNKPSPHSNDNRLCLEVATNAKPAAVQE